MGSSWYNWRYMIETFIQHPKYKRLLVGNMGTLVSNATWIVLKTIKTNKGYEELKFREGSRTDGTRKTINLKVHRLVAEIFISNEENKPTVNHKDGNKLNNRSENLEWATWTENSRHAFATGLKKGKKLSIEHKEKLHSAWREWWISVGYKYRQRNERGQFNSKVGVDPFYMKGSK